MSISLNNHESRIKVLENTGITSPTILATNSFGKCIKFGSLLIQGGNFDNAEWSERTITFPKAFSQVFFLDSNMTPNGFNLSNTSVTFHDTHCGVKVKIVAASWIAIGILYTYRYIIKSLLIFTPLSYLFNEEV